MSKKLKIFFIVLVTITITFSLGTYFSLTYCRESYPPTDITNNSVIPKPVSVTATNGTFVLDDSCKIYVESGNEALLKNAEFLAELLRNATGFKIKIKETRFRPWRGNIFLTTQIEEVTPSSEYYELRITEKLITIASVDEKGSFYGIQTLRQLLPAVIEKSGVRKEPFLLPTGIIKDKPN